MNCVWRNENSTQRGGRGLTYIITSKLLYIIHFLVKALLDLISVSMACILRSLSSSGIPCNSILGTSAVLCKRTDSLCVNLITSPNINILPARNFKSSLQIQSAKRIPAINEGRGSRPYTPRRALM